VDALERGCAHKLPVVTVAGAGMISEANHKATDAAGPSIILGIKIPTSPIRSSSGGASTGPGHPAGYVFT
jgi:hypothetical protein